LASTGIAAARRSRISRVSPTVSVCPGSSAEVLEVELLAVALEQQVPAADRRVAQCHLAVDRAADEPARAVQRHRPYGAVAEHEQAETGRFVVAVGHGQGRALPRCAGGVSGNRTVDARRMSVRWESNGFR
jgi:hypothetical protein